MAGVTTLKNEHEALPATCQGTSETQLYSNSSLPLAQVKEASMERPESVGRDQDLEPLPPADRRHPDHGNTPMRRISW